MRAGIAAAAATCTREPPPAEAPDGGDGGDSAARGVGAVPRTAWRKQRRDDWCALRSVTPVYVAASDLDELRRSSTASSRCSRTAAQTVARATATTRARGPACSQRQSDFWRGGGAAFGGAFPGASGPSGQRLPAPHTTRLGTQLRVRG